jgi:hypothetical protein
VGGSTFYRLGYIEEGDDTFTDNYPDTALDYTHEAIIAAATVYDTISEVFPSGAFRSYLDGERRSGFGARGNWSFDTPVGDPVKMVWEMLGLMADAETRSDAAVPTNTTFTAADARGSANPGLPPRLERTGFKLYRNGTIITPLRIKNIGCTPGTGVTPRGDAADEGAPDGGIIEIAIVKESDPRLRLTIERSKDASVLDPVKAMLAGDRFAAHFKVGSGTNGIWKFMFPFMFMAEAPVEADTEDGIRCWQLNLQPVDSGASATLPAFDEGRWFRMQRY